MKLSIDEIRKQLVCGVKIADLDLRVTGYIRVSTAHEEQKTSLENQDLYFTNKIRENSNWAFVPLYIDDAKSGTNVDNRPDFLRMINDAKNGKFDLILTKEVSRFARDLLDTIKFTRELLQYNVGVIFEDIGLNTMEADAELRLAIMASMAQEESRKLSDRVKFGYAISAEKGRRRGAVPPLGYLFDNTNNGYLIDESKAPIIQYIFNEYAKNRKGTRVIAADLEGMGYVNENGHMYNTTTITRILQNPMYYGNLVFAKSSKPSYRNNKKIARPREEWILRYDPERVPPLIDKPTWDKANTILNERGKVAKSVSCSAKDELGGGKYTYSSRIVCEEHNCHYIRTISRWYVDGEKKEAEYWRCSLYKKYGKKRCDAPILYTRDLNVVMSIMFKQLAEECSMNEKKQRVSVANFFENVLAPQKQAEEMAKLQQKIDDIALKKERLLDGWINNIVPTPEYQKALQKLDETLESLIQKMNDIQHLKASLDVIENTRASISKTLAECTFDNDEVIEDFVRAFVKKIVIVQSKDDPSEYILKAYIFGMDDEPFIQHFALCNRTASWPLACAT